MNEKQNRIWRFLASVQLALWVIGLLAATSIIGTFIQQNKQLEHYLENYGPEMTRLLQTLDIIPNMYSSWWFITLLIIFVVNLIICSLDRLPATWRLINQDNLNVTPQRLAKMPLQREMNFAEEPPAAAERLEQRLTAIGWQPGSRNGEEGTLLFAQKGAWSRLGAYLVHLGILITLGGALIGGIWGFKGTIMFPEGETVDFIFDGTTAELLPLDFSIYLDEFEISFYPDGTPREFRSDVIISDPASNSRRRDSILVNHPLRHRGITFYQASYRALEQYLVHLRNQTTGAEIYLLALPDQELHWPEENLTLQVAAARSDQLQRVLTYQVSLQSPEAPPSVFTMADRQTVTVDRPEHPYNLYLQQRYSTGLQVARDPGVWVVYSGFALICLGLYLTFMVSHRRLWLLLTPAGKGSTRLLLCGGSNRNRASFDQQFDLLAAQLSRDETRNKD
ncbi:cytochrome c biogenesis protein ResB [Desulfurivibrio alkaliphilus]|uniref:ResB family protein n=1 Tax=Desulfurivibrio alkaliphilus (strain DSM 19089 / UNIQEM U267 / AHT2) TaxID=589865 RepID=D6YZV8_DESAT|nr:cytochrome c biogenesis protein ResB [Desulfurivibrio alkaliphilus]ADH85115.1 ResB family protein [Desulfurivibrio alkaliphilus AHT 2]